MALRVRKIQFSAVRNKLTNPTPVEPNENPRSTRAIGDRLELTRVALGFNSQAEFCRRAGIQQNTYNQWETGKSKNRPRLDYAFRLVDEFGLTLDWIYLGAGGALPADVAFKIAIEREKRKLERQADPATSKSLPPRKAIPTPRVQGGR